MVRVALAILVVLSIPVSAQAAGSSPVTVYKTGAVLFPILRPTLYIGEHKHGLYALPSLVDSSTVHVITSQSRRPLIDGPREPGQSAEANGGSGQLGWTMLGSYGGSILGLAAGLSVGTHSTALDKRPEGSSPAWILASWRGQSALGPTRRRSAAWPAPAARNRRLRC